MVEPGACGWNRGLEAELQHRFEPILLDSPLEEATTHDVIRKGICVRLAFGLCRRQGVSAVASHLPCDAPVRSPAV